MVAMFRSLFLSCKSSVLSWLSSDKNWTQLIYSREFLDSPIKDVHLNTISHAILEQLLFIKKIISQSNNSRNLLPNNTDIHLTNEEIQFVVSRAKEIRDDLFNTSIGLLKYIENMDREVLKFLQDNGVNYSEVER